MRPILLLVLFLLSAPLVTHADSSSIVNLNPNTATPDPTVSTPDPTVATPIPTYTPTPTVVPTANPVTGASPLAGIVIIVVFGMAGYLYVLQRRSSQQ